MFRCIWLAVLAVIAMTGSAAQAGDRVALVIGNGAYSNVPALANPAADTALIATALRKVGFRSITTVRDAGKAAFDAALRDFADKADGADVALIYYAGHGIEVGRENYLVPTDARLLRDRDLEYEAIALDKIRRSIGGAKLRLIILDACRENPFATKMMVLNAGRSVMRGLARIEPNDGELVVYAAKEGKIAADGNGANSPFATALARYLGEPGLEISLLFRKVRDDVLRSTGGQQEPYTYGSLPGTPTYLGPSGAASAREPIASPARRPERPASAEARLRSEPAPPAAGAALCVARMISISHPVEGGLAGTKWYAAISGNETVRISRCDSATGQFSTLFPFDAGSLTDTSGTVSARRIVFDFGYALRGGYQIRCSVSGTATEPGKYQGTISCGGRKTAMNPKPATIEF